MRYMFEGCSSLKSLNIDNFTFNEETYVKGMFSGCTGDLQTKINNKFDNLRGEVFK